MKPFALLAIAALLPGLAFGADVAPVASSIQCFGQEVRIESECQRVGNHPIFKECRRQTLHIGKKTVELLGSDKSLATVEWACSADKKMLLLMQSNGGSCNECEKYVAFDKEGRKVRANGRERPDWRNVDVLPPAR